MFGLKTIESLALRYLMRNAYRGRRQPPGHFYSPIPSIEEITRDSAKIFVSGRRSVPGIEMNEINQLELLDIFSQFYTELPFHSQKIDGHRYYYENGSYTYSDAIFFYCMLRYLKPKRLIEVGSGFSSCLMLDTNEIFFDNSIKTTFVEPFPKVLLSLIKESDKKATNILSCRLQDVDISEFKLLKKNDILFIDSSHVSKVGSDVNRIFFEILPCLASGVYIHFHDIFYPFEYPKTWFLDGLAWNEVYILKSFLQFNDRFSVVLMNSFFDFFYKKQLAEKMPLCLKSSGGSIWIRKG